MVYKCDDPADELTGRPAGYGTESAWPVDEQAAELGDYSAGWRITEDSGNRSFTVFHHWGDPVRLPQSTQRPRPLPKSIVFSM
jgi:hypothetical protein